MKIDKGIIISALIAFIVGIVAMPREECSGDAMATRVETVHLIKECSFGVPNETAKEACWGDRGMFFDENIYSGKWYPKYGIFNSLIYVPALQLERLIAGKLEYNSTPLRLLLLNIHNIIMSIFIAVTLYLTARIFTSCKIASIIYVVFCLYGTFFWYYLRAQIFEIHTALIFIIATFAACKSMKAKNDEHYSKIWMLSCGIFLGILILTKTVYVVLIPAYWILLVWVHWDKDPKKVLTKMSWFLIPIMLSITLLLFFNHLKFGSVLNTGYTQWKVEASPLSGNFQEGIWGYLFDGQWGIFCCFAPLFIALFYWREFFKNNNEEAVLILLLGFILLSVNSCFVNWRGTWCYGPRYLLPILPLASLPIILLLERVFKEQNTPLRILAVFLLLSFIAIQISRQNYINKLPFYSWYQLDGILSQKYNKSLARYMYANPFWVIYRDMNLVKCGKGSQLTGLLNSVQSPDIAARAKMLIKEMPMNYYLFQ